MIVYCLRAKQRLPLFFSVSSFGVSWASFGLCIIACRSRSRYYAISFTPFEFAFELLSRLHSYSVMCWHTLLSLSNAIFSILLLCFSVQFCSFLLSFPSFHSCSLFLSLHFLFADTQERKMRRKHCSKGYSPHMATNSPMLIHMLMCWWLSCETWRGKPLCNPLYLNS